MSDSTLFDVIERFDDLRSNDDPGDNGSLALRCIFAGGPTGLSTAPIARFDGRGFGIGDVNGDGFDDVLTAYGLPGSNHVSILLGRDGGPAATPAATYSPGTVAEAAAAGDVNGDRIDDFVLGEPAESAGRAEVFSGRESALESLEVITLTDPATRFNYGISVATSGRDERGEPEGRSKPSRSTSPRSGLADPLTRSGRT